MTLCLRETLSRPPCLRHRSRETKHSFSAKRRFWSKDVEVRADLGVQQSRHLEVAEQPQPSGQFGGDQQRSRQSLGWIAGTNPLPLFFHEFSDRQPMLPYPSNTVEVRALAGESAQVTKDVWQAACLGGITRERILILSPKKYWEQNSALLALTVVGAGA